MDFGKRLVAYAMVRNEQNLGSFPFSTSITGLTEVTEK